MGYRTEFTWECDTLNCNKKDSLGATLPFGTTVLDVMIENGWTVINAKVLNLFTIKKVI